MVKKPYNVAILKSSGETVDFSEEKLRSSLLHSGANHEQVQAIIDKILPTISPNLPTKAIYKMAFRLLKKDKPYFAAKYKLKKAIYELGPTGFPFEAFIAEIFKEEGYHTEVGIFVEGACVTHEIDVVVTSADEVFVVECKFHSEEGRPCDVKIPLYVRSRFEDVKKQWNRNASKKMLTQGWVATNTRFTADAKNYALCAGLNLLSWDFPEGNALKHKIDKMALYPITVLTTLTQAEKQLIINERIVLCRQLMENQGLLNKIGVSANRKERVLNELSFLCKH